MLARTPNAVMRVLPGVDVPTRLHHAIPDWLRPHCSMILPTKHLPPERSLIHVGGEVLKVLDDGPLPVSAAWETMRDGEGRYPLSFEWFALALSLLYAMGLVELEDDLLVLREPQ